LQLRTWRRLDPHRRDIGRARLLPHRRHRALHRAQPDHAPLLAQQTMDDHGIALGDTGVERLRLAHDILGEPPQRARLVPGDERRRPAIPVHGVSRHAELFRNRLGTPAATRQLANRGDDLSLDHRYLRCRRYQIPSLELHSTTSLRGVRINGARGSISLSLYNEDGPVST
jgi:hypothetical protein